MNKEKVAKTKSELIMALEQLERERNIKTDDVFKTIEESMVSALRKHVGKTSQIAAVVDRETGQISAYMILKVTDNVVNPETEILLQDAVRISPKAEIGQEIKKKLDVTDFSRIAAQTTKQVLIQKIREIEKEKLYEEFKPREGEVVTGSVHRFIGRDIMVDLGKSEAILPFSEQIRKERYNVNGRVRAIIARVEREHRGPQIVLSRAAPLFLKRLFETEIPEVSEKVVEILDIVRDPGFRAKVLVKSNSSKVDPIGACVGIRGSRIRGIMNELSGERIDLIQHSEDVQQLLAHAFAPATVTSVKIVDKENKKAYVIVPDDQLAIAIGREGQNIRLASKLTGWSLDVKSEGQKLEEGKKAQEAVTQDLTQIEGVGPKIAEILIKTGFTDVSRLATLNPEDLSAFQGIGLKTAAKIIQGAKKYLAEKGKEPQSGSGKGEDAGKTQAEAAAPAEEVKNNEADETAQEQQEQQKGSSAD